MERATGLVASFACASALALAGCGSTSPAEKGSALDHPVLILGADYTAQASALGRIETDGTLREVTDPVLGADSFLSMAGDRAYVVVDDDDTLRAVEVGKLGLEKTPIAIPAGTGAGQAYPQDVDVDETGKLWVTRLGRGSLVVVDPAGGPAKEVDLSTFDPDGVPQMAGVRVVDGRAFVALELLDETLQSSSARGPGLVAEIDTTTRAVKKHTLVGRNPFRHLVSAGKDELLVATPGDIDAVTATDGIDALDLATGVARQLISEPALCGSAGEVAWAGEDELYAIVFGPDPGVEPTSLVAIRPSDGAVSVLARTSTYAFSGLTVVGDRVLVGDRTPTQPAIRVFDRAKAFAAGGTCSGAANGESELAPYLLDGPPPLSLVTLTTE